MNSKTNIAFIERLGNTTTNQIEKRAYIDQQLDFFKLKKENSEN